MLPCQDPVTLLSPQSSATCPSTSSPSAPRPGSQSRTPQFCPPRHPRPSSRARPMSRFPTTPAAHAANRRWKVSGAWPPLAWRYQNRPSAHASLHQWKAPSMEVLQIVLSYCLLSALRKYQGVSVLSSVVQTKLVMVVLVLSSVTQITTLCYYAEVRGFKISPCSFREQWELVLWWVLHKCITTVL